MFEVRIHPETVEFRSSGPRGNLAVGYAFRYHTLSKNLGGFVERVMPGSATKTVKEQDIVGLFNHQTGNLLGRLSSGTLRMADDGAGMRYEIDLPNTTLGRDVGELLARGDITGSSFGFKAVGRQGATWTRTDDGYPVREIRLMMMRDVGPVTLPAYNDSDAALRSLCDERSLPFDEVSQAASENRLAELLFSDGDSNQAARNAPVLRRYY